MFVSHERFTSALLQDLLSTNISFNSLQAACDDLYEVLKKLIIGNSIARQCGEMISNPQGEYFRINAYLRALSTLDDDSTCVYILLGGVLSIPGIPGRLWRASLLLCC